MFSMEHRDTTALHYYDQGGKDKYYKNMNILELNSVWQRLGTRQNEIDALINELPTIVKENLGLGA